MISSFSLSGMEQNCVAGLYLAFIVCLMYRLKKKQKFALTTFPTNSLRTSFTGCSPSANLPKGSVGGALAAYK